MDCRSRVTLFAATAACLAVVTTGCSKSSAGPSVAQLTTPAATAAPSADGSSAPNGSAAPTGGAGLLAYSECMRAHGVPDFPDPVGDSLQVKAGPGSDLNPNSPQMQTAQKACQSLQPGGGKGGTISPAQQAQALKYSACMRSNAVPNFPDPVFSNGGAQLKITNIDPNSPQFVAAQKACQSLQPGRGGGGIGVGQSGQGATGGGAQTGNSGP
jgi:hypothetical protein